MEFKQRISKLTTPLWQQNGNNNSISKTLPTFKFVGRVFFLCHNFWQSQKPNADYRKEIECCAELHKDFLKKYIGACYVIFGIHKKYILLTIYIKYVIIKNNLKFGYQSENIMLEGMV